MEIGQTILELENEISKINEDINRPSSVLCTHVRCESCEKAIEQEAKDKSWNILILNEKTSLLEKIKQYGSGQ
jgi:hypothetical protein